MLHFQTEIIQYSDHDLQMEFLVMGRSEMVF